MCERTKTKVTTVDVSPRNTDCDEKDEAVTSDAGLYKEAWPLIVSRLGYNRVLELSRKGAKQLSCAHIYSNIWFTLTQSLPRLLLYRIVVLLTRLYFGTLEYLVDSTVCMRLYFRFFMLWKEKESRTRRGPQAVVILLLHINTPIHLSIYSGKVH